MHPSPTDYMKMNHDHPLSEYGLVPPTQFLFQPARPAVGVTGSSIFRRRQLVDTCENDGHPAVAVDGVATMERPVHLRMMPTSAALWALVVQGVPECVQLETSNAVPLLAVTKTSNSATASTSTTPTPTSVSSSLTVTPSSRPSKISAPTRLASSILTTSTRAAAIPSVSPPSSTSPNNPTSSQVIISQSAIAGEESLSASASNGLPTGAQIAIGVVVPVLVILIVVALWFFVFRKPTHGVPFARLQDSDLSSFYSPTPPPDYTKKDQIVVSVVRSSVVTSVPPPANNRQPEAEDDGDSFYEMATLTDDRPGSGPLTIWSPPVGTRGGSHTDEEGVSPTSDFPGLGGFR
ncbi:hypothetical protein B0H66DRAFT_592097 [Apodospora peruviana]|uniref:Mid2 domain-containing protein n=1 Tax=Apodospora peruviana TaxID=516989 RepID=A0AAE0HZL4_9PEZI|nr:hypothetical protein B0H66DRAFT_592097 [Apodospora peruviana]